MFKTVHRYYVYILTNKKDGTLYTGVTNNLERRVFEHKNKLYQGFTLKYNLDKLVYFEEYQHVNEAILREKRIKKWKRAWKINLITKENPEWRDLAADWRFLPSQEWQALSPCSAFYLPPSRKSYEDEGDSE